MPPVAPMLAKAADELPEGEGWIYEPKWDGFRCIVFRDGDEVELGSRNERPLTRYFPEVVAAVCSHLPARCVIDGEILIPGAVGLDFDALLQRIHPADSRVQKLAAETPASFVAFDLLAVGDRDLTELPLSERRAMLESVTTTRPPIFVTPISTDIATAKDWFSRFEGAGLDGVVAKRADLPYRPGERVMVKVKHRRTADCVVAGYRIHKDGNGVGSLLLGLYDDSGDLQHVGVASSFTAKRRRELLEELRPLLDGALDGHPWQGWAEAVEREQAEGRRMPGAVSRWNAKKDLSWTAIRAERVAEVQFDQLQGRRFRHATSFVRWRPDREPSSCTYDQLEVAAPLELASVFGGPGS
jgi:ATP-dependent DNA ligase